MPPASVLGPQRVYAAASPWPLHDAAASRRIEQAALAEAPAHALMERAGLAAARLALAVAPQARRTTVLAGPGNNGGDGLVAARHLALAGRRVRVVHLADPTRLPTDAAQALGDARAAGVRIDDEITLFEDDELIVDALLGLGTSRAAQGRLAAAIAAANAHSAPVLAIDLPSGLDGDHGVRLGDAVIDAQWTLCLLTLKPGLFTHHGRDQAGEVWLDTLCIDTAVQPPTAMLGAAAASPCEPLATRRHRQHKGSFGDVLVVGGSAGMQGALWLATRAALAAGAGRVYASPLDIGASGFDAGAPEVMLRAQAWHMPAADLVGATVVCGCGGGTAVAAVLPPLLAHAGFLVLDADALNAIANDSQLGAQLEARGRRQAATVLTPHPLEAARLLGASTPQVQDRRLDAARTLSERFGAVVVLKGSGSVIARPGALPWINASGNAALATPGTGDVLAGWIGGHGSALGAAANADRAWDAARHVVWLHGHAADRHAPHTPLPLTAGRLIAAMRSASV